jgi:flagellar basal-body rod protein FlgG
MLRGLYTSASGMMLQMARQGAVSHNLANATTTGFKQDVTSQSLFHSLLLNRIERSDQPVGEYTAQATPLGPLVTTAGAQRSRIDLGQGAMTATGLELDIALSGPGFLQVQTANGPRLTRDGALLRDAQGRLVAADGSPVLGPTGPLTLPDGPISIAHDGRILAGDRPVGQLQIVELPADQLIKDGLNRFRPRAGAQPAASPTTTIHQGFIEASNVDMTRAITEMMAAARAFEAGQRLIQVQDDLLAKTVNDVGRL